MRPPLAIRSRNKLPSTREQGKESAHRGPRGRRLIGDRDSDHDTERHADGPSGPDDGRRDATRERGPARPPGSIVRMGLLFYGAMGIAALLWRMSTPGDSILFPSPEAQARAWSLPAAIAVGVAAGLVAIAFSEALTRCGGKKREAAQLLGIDPKNFGYYLRKQGLSEAGEPEP